VSVLVRIVEIIALVAVAVAAGVGGFKLRELFGNLTGENITQPITEAFSGVGESLGNVGSTVGSVFQGPVQQEVVSESFTNVPPEQRTPFDALGAGLGGLFSGIGNIFNTNPESVRPDPRVNGEAVSFGPALSQPESINDFVNRFVPSQEPTPVVAEPISIQSEIEGQQFLGGSIGQGIVGGVVRETPIADLSLGQIIDRFNVSASEAANIQAIAEDNFGNFDFGTNTGSGIGSVTTRPDINPNISGGNVSNPEFAGLTAAEIAERLTGGNINNF
jgi:Flp pilus assembly pilin Flp